MSTREDQIDGNKRVAVGASEVARRANLDALKRRRDKAAEDTSGAIDKQIDDAEMAILEAPVIDDQDALAVALIAASWSAPDVESHPGALACESGMLAVLDHLARRSGDSASELGLSSYWAEVRGAPECRAHAAALREMDQTKAKNTLRATVDALRVNIRPGELMAVRCGQFMDFYGDDAELVSDALDIVINHRRDGDGGRIALCGVPANAFDELRPSIEVMTGRHVVMVEPIAG